MKFLLHHRILALAFAGLTVALGLASGKEGQLDDREIEKQLSDKAAHVVVGIVKAMHVTRSTGRGDERLEAITAKILVSSVEKGDGIKAGEMISVRFHRRRGPDTRLFFDVPVHDPVPTEGFEVRAYLDQSMRVLETNGFVLHPNNAIRKVVRANTARTTVDPQANEELVRRRLSLQASHAVIAKVLRITKIDVQTSFSFQHTKLIAQVEVLEVKKGADIDKGDHINIEYFKQEILDSKKSPQRTAANYRKLPDVVDTIEVFLLKTNADNYKVSFPDGFFEITKPTAKPPETKLGEYESVKGDDS